MDVLQHRFSEVLDVLQRHGLAVDKLLGVRRTHRDGPRHAEGDPHPVEGLFILAEPGVNGGSQRGDIHGVAHGVLDIVAEAVFIAFLRDQHGGLDLAVLRPDVHLARLDVEIMDGQAADTVFARQLNDGVPRVEGGGGVGGGNAVAGVAADGADVDVDLDDIGDTVSGDTGFLSILSNVKIPGVVIGSICDGIVNSLMTLRIGYVTRNYLIDGMNSLNGIKAKRKAKRAAVKEALKSLPKVVVVGTSFVGKGAMNIILNIIGGKKVKETNEN